MNATKGHMLPTPGLGCHLPAGKYVYMALYGEIGLTLIYTGCPKESEMCINSLTIKGKWAMYIEKKFKKR